MAEEQRRQGLDAETVRRLQRALTASATELFALLSDPSPEVLRALLKNPQLNEEHLLVLLGRRDLPEEWFKAVLRLKFFEGSHRLKVALAKNPATPTALLQTLLPHLYLFELLDLVYLPAGTADQKVAAERILLQRLPTTPLGSKIALARRGTAPLLDALLKEGEAALLDACLQNPRLKEVSILQFLNGPRATAATISAIARHPRWQQRPNLRLAILKNRHTPGIWFTVYLPQLKPAELQGLLGTRRLSAMQQQLVIAELHKRGLS